MGEYAKLKGTGKEIKIGTCENMYYLRFDQREMVWPQRGNVNPMTDTEHIRFRFPWPDEDDIQPGSFEDPDKRLAVQAPAPEDMEHGIVQFVASREGYNVCLPCPEGPSSHGLTVHRNGFKGATFLVQQRVWEDRLVGVMECVCGHRYRLPTIEDAEPVIASLLNEAESRLRYKEVDRANYLIEVAKRLREGYGLNTTWVVA